MPSPLLSLPAPPAWSHPSHSAIKRASTGEQMQSSQRPRGRDTRTHTTLRTCNYAPPQPHDVGVARHLPQQLHFSYDQVRGDSSRAKGVPVVRKKGRVEGGGGVKNHTNLSRRWRWRLCEVIGPRSPTEPRVQSAWAKQDRAATGFGGGGGVGWTLLSRSFAKGTWLRNGTYATRFIATARPCRNTRKTSPVPPVAKASPLATAASASWMV